MEERKKLLSNFVKVKIILDGIEYPSVEHAYMSAKNEDPVWKEFCSSGKHSSARVKKASRNVDLIPDWDKKKVEVMTECINQKFNQEPFRTLLKNTGEEYIQESNYWGDKFWGVCLKTGKGKNTLGKIIMKIRSKL